MQNERRLYPEGVANLFHIAGNALILIGLGIPEPARARMGASRRESIHGGSARNGFRKRVMDGIGNSDRVTLMQRLVALQVEHRDLDAVIHRLAESAGHDQLQVTRLKRRKLLLKDQITWLERQIDPDVSA